MGSFNTRGFLSNTTIMRGDEIVAFVCKFYNKKSGRYFYYPFDAYTPIVLPVYGRYDGYGGIDNIVEDDNYKWIKKYVGKMEDIVECARVCMDIWRGGSIRDEINNDNRNRIKEKSIYVLDNLLEYDGMEEIYGVAILYEHKEIYENWAYPYNGKYGDSNDIDSMFQKFYNSTLDVLLVQRWDDDFLKRNISEIRKLQEFYWFMLVENLPMRPQSCGNTQSTSYKKDIAICKRTLEFLEKKQAEYDEFYGEDDYVE